MKTVTINNFSGGVAEDLREQKTNTFSTCKGFDSTHQDHKLIPYGEQEAEALTSGNISDKLITDIIRINSGLLCAVGRNSGATPTVVDLLEKDSPTDITSTWDVFTSLSAGSSYRPNSLSYYGAIYLLDEAFNVKKYYGTWSTLGAVDIVSYWPTMLVPKPFLHPLDDILYFAGNQALGLVDAGVYSDITNVVIPSNLYVSSLTDYGSYLAIACTPSYSGVSRVFLWDRDTSSTTFTESINWGEDSLLILENIDGVLVGVSINEQSYVPTTTYTTVKNKKLKIKAYSGGTPILIKEIDVDDTFTLRNFKQKVNGRLYFGGDNDDSLYVVYKDRQGKIIVSRDRLLNNGSTITTLRGFSVIDDYLFTMFDTALTTGNVYRTKVSPSYTATSTYESLINPGMEISDRTKKKTLKSVSVAKSSTTGQLVVKYSVDGSAYTTIGTLSASGSLVLKATNESTGKPLESGYEYQFKVESTGGAEFTELKYSYEVMPELI